jgi:hypothetical protein
MIQTHHLATTQTTVEVDLDCPACGYAGTAVVRSEGRGSAASFLTYDRTGARQLAAEEAAEDAVHQARVTATLLRCPRCRRRSRASLAQFVALTALGVAALLALACVAWWFDPGLVGGAIAGVCAVTAAQLARRKRRQLRGAEASVESVRARALLPAAQAVHLGPATATSGADDADAPVERDPTWLR